MSLLRNMSAGVRSLFRRKEADGELEEELREFMEMAVQEKMNRGMDRADAIRAVRLERGSLDLNKEVIRSATWESVLETCWRDVCYGLRMLRKNPGFATIAILTLALGIAANTTIFTALDATAFRTLPVRDSDHIVRVYRWIRQGYGGTLFSVPEYVYYSGQSDAFSGLAADSCCYNVVYDAQSATSAARMPASALLNARLVSGNYFEVLGVNAVLGRTFLPQEGQSENSNPEVVLSHQFWQKRFNSDPSIVGTSLILNTTPFTVVGIAPSNFIGTGDPPEVPDAWIPLAMQHYIVPGRDWFNDPNTYNVRLVGHLKPDIGLKKTQAALTVLAQRLAATPSARAARNVSGFALTASTTHLTVKRASFLDFGGTGAEFAASVTLALAAVAIVLLIACANIANLLLARATARQKEVAARLVLGASRGRLIRQLLTESAVIALVGGMVGLLLSTWACHLLWFFGQRLLQTFYPADLLVRVNPDIRILAYTLLLSLAATFVFGLAPALQASKTDLTFALKQSAGTSALRSRSFLTLNLREGLVLVQVSLSLMLLVSVGLLARGLQRSQTISPGFETNHLLGVDLDFTALGYATSTASSLRREVVERLDALPEIKSVSFASEGSTHIVLESGRSLAQGASYTVVSPDYFGTLGIQIVRGRNFGETTQSGAPEVIVSEATARLLWPGEDPIGKRLMARDRSSSYAEVVGVASDVRSGRLLKVEFAHLYLPIAPTDEPDVLWVRTRSNPETAFASIRDVLGAVDKALPLAPMYSANDLLLLHRLPALIGTVMAGVLGALALILVAIGIYGVVAYLVSQRTHEIGVRMALGCDKADVLALVFMQGMRPVALGIILGLVGAVALSHTLSFFLFGVSPLDPLAFSSASMFLVTVALCASYIPARRAMRVDPMVALRHE